MCFSNTMRSSSSTDLHSRPPKWCKIKTLGKGGFAEVFLAKLTCNNKLIAVKTAKFGNCKSNSASSLVKEKRILERFRNCSEIVYLYRDEITIESGVGYYSLLLEYASGDLLDLIVKAGGRVVLESDIQACTRMMLKGLKAIHAKGIVHCDIKPENILVFPSESGYRYRLKITDFGLAKEPGEEVSESKKYRFRGTPDYMSPESVARGEISTAMDIWALGCVVVVMITGRSLWQQAGKELDTKKILSLLAFTEAIPEIPKHMSETGKDFLRKCLQRDPSKRWSAEKLLEHPYVSTTTT